MTVKEMVMAKETIGYISACGGIEIKEIVYSIDDHVVFVAGAWRPNKSAHKRKIYYNGNGAYFIYAGQRFNFNEVVRC